jgi:hypothetical protein
VPVSGEEQNGNNSNLSFMSGAANGQQDVVMGNETTKNGKKTSGKQSVSNTKKFIQISQN